MRTGEVCALTWDDIDLEKGIINIEHNVYDKPNDDKGRWFIGSTKTQTGTRKVHISHTLKIALQNYKNKQDYLKNYMEESIFIIILKMLKINMEK